MRVGGQERREIVSDELFNRVTEEHLLNIICKGLAKIKENQIVGLFNSRESHPVKGLRGKGKEQ